MRASICIVLPILFTFACLLSASAAHDASVEYCNKKADYPVKVKGVDINPYPISRGKEATFNISAYTGKGIAKGKLVVDVTYLIFHVYQETHDLCTKTTCPISSGDFSISHGETLPVYTPPGSYTLQMKLLGEDDEELTCITFGFSIGFLSSIADI
ncbi:hypothetical protein HPP92_000987 [Vanilla planifolia]|uniref:MD-2-related lipid-recognition domain-containing protein n=1 Tax=Vanilla planifolia TaxID=51239 RepID=A0A835RQ81_VANPL|nr:hypothetical protein HPP92_000987 [Vanilla planifolia]